MADKTTEFMTPREVGELLGVNPKTVLSWGRSAAIDFPRALQIGIRTIRFRRAEILSWIATSSVGKAGFAIKETKNE